MEIVLRDRATFGRGTDLKGAACNGDSFVQTCQSNAVRAGFLFAETNPVILNGQRDLVILHAQIHPDLAGLRMLDHIGQSFLKRAIERNVIGIWKLGQG